MVRLLALGGVGIVAAVVIGGAALVQAGQIERIRAEAAAVSAANVGVTRMDVEHANSQIATRDALIPAGNRLATAQADESDAEHSVDADWNTVAGLALPADLRAQVGDLHGALIDYLATSARDLAALAKVDAGSPEIKAAMDALDVRVKAVDDKMVATEDALAQRERQDDTRLASATKQLRVTVIVALIVAVLVTALVSILIGQSINRPLRRLRDRLAGVAQGGGDLTARLEVDGRDDLTHVARLFNSFVESVAATVRVIADVSQTLSHGSQRLTTASSQLGAGAGDTTAGVDQASATAHQVAEAVGSMSAATEQLTASIAEIASQAASAAGIATTAVTTVAETSSAVAELGDASHEIGEIVRTITAIAEQTNLLALNATIEAARAGDAGKGFAVVAAEVKDLAGETSTATDDITRKITGIQRTTTQAMEAMSRITVIIDDINAMQTTIAAAVEEQNATTAEISRTASTVAAGAGRVAGNLNAIATTATSTSSAAAVAEQAATEFGGLTNRLQGALRQFTY